MDAEKYEYPVKAVPWDPKDAVDPRLKAIRDDRGYSYADIITVRECFFPRPPSFSARFSLVDVSFVRSLLSDLSPLGSFYSLFPKTRTTSRDSR